MLDLSPHFAGGWTRSTTAFSFISTSAARAWKAGKCYLSRCSLISSPMYDAAGFLAKNNSFSINSCIFGLKWCFIALNAKLWYVPYINRRNQFFTGPFVGLVPCSRVARQWSEGVLAPSPTTRTPSMLSKRGPSHKSVKTSRGYSNDHFTWPSFVS